MCVCCDEVSAPDNRGSLSHREPSIPRIDDNMKASPSMVRNRSRSLPRLHPGYRTARSTKSMKRPDDTSDYQLQVNLISGANRYVPPLFRVETVWNSVSRSGVAVTIGRRHVAGVHHCGGGVFLCSTFMSVSTCLYSAGAGGWRRTRQTTSILATEKSLTGPVI